MRENALPTVEAVDVKRYFRVRNGWLHAVDGVSFRIMSGLTLGVVGESGCGKSTLGRTVIGLDKPTGGDISFKGQSIVSLSLGERKKMYTKMSMIFQDPYSSINPRMCVADLIADPMRINNAYGNSASRYKRVGELMDVVGLARRVAGSYPHELDGGRRQRIGIARALALNPEFIVCDEPVSALDVSIQAQILNLLMDLQESMGLTYMFITHNLSVVHHISNHIMVMYLGKCVEMASTDEIFRNPLHPYTRALLSALPEPTLESRLKKPEILRGEVSNPVNPKPGCRFAPRCPHVSEACTAADLPLHEVENGHTVACTLYMSR
jgi:peptide/nickel transport system ATP-binding protein